MPLHKLETLTYQYFFIHRLIIVNSTLTSGICFANKSKKTKIARVN